MTTPDSRAPRAKVHARVACTVALAGTGVETRGYVKNLNADGMAAWTDHRLPPESSCEIHLQFDGQAPDVHVHGWVVYANEHGMAIQFDSLGPQERATIEDVTARFLTPA